MRKPDGRRRDGFDFAVGFVFGLPFGALAALVLRREWPVPWPGGWLCLLGGAVAVGLLAGWLGDRFWHRFLRLFRGSGLDFAANCP